MNCCICCWILLLALTGPSDTGTYPEQGWNEFIAKLRSIDSVSGRAVGFYGVPGEFFKLSRTMIATGNEQDFQRLLSDEHAVVRCMGLLALAQTRGKTAAPVLRSYLDDQGRIEYQPAGCCAYTTMVGHFVWSLLLNANHLGHSDVPAPLLTESERVHLEIEFLAADLPMGDRLDATTHLAAMLRDGPLPTQLSAFKAHAPALEDCRIIKAVGRLPPSTKQRDFLIACLCDSSLDADARLAAGSALTRYTDDVSLQAIQKERGSLNRLDERHWGDQFLATVNARKIHETNREPLVVEREWNREQISGILRPLFESQDQEPADPSLLAKRAWRDLDEIKDRVIVACTSRHPLALRDLSGDRNLHLVRHDPDVRRALASSVIEISRNLEDYAQAWSTYADCASALASWIQAERETDFQETRILTDAECAQIEKNIAEPARRIQERQARETAPAKARDGNDGDSAPGPGDGSIGVSRTPLLAHDLLWPLVAQSGLIVTGTLQGPGERIRSNVLSGNHDYVDLAVTVDEVVKGRNEGPLVVRYFTEPMSYSVDPYALLEMLKGSKALLFLVQVDGVSAGNYFAGHTPHALQTCDSGRLEQVRRETRRQADVLGDFERLFPPEKEPLYTEVKRLIDATTNKETQTQAFARLEELGVKAVPAIIMLMDDRRGLGVNSISLRNYAVNAFEGLRHYGPETVVDAMAAILNQITGQSFGTIHNGGSEQQREAAVHGWRMYLYHLQYGDQGHSRRQGSGGCGTGQRPSCMTEAGYPAGRLYHGRSIR